MVPENDIDYGSREIPAWIEDATDAILLHLMNFPPDAETTANRLIQPYLHYIDANGEYRERPYDLFTGECDVVDTLHRKARDHGLYLDSSAYDGMIIGAPGSIPFRVRRLGEIRSDKRRGIVFGAAAGDALGVPYEFLKRDTFECTGMSEGGVHGKPAGTFSDDTSLLLATCASLKERGKVDVEDMRRRFCDWLYKGAYTSGGSAFDVGNATATALERGRGCDGERSNGNGSLMRIAPLVFVHASDDEVRAVSAITHAHWISTEACVMFVRILGDLMDGECLEDAIAHSMPSNERFALLRDLVDMPRDAVKSSGFVLDTLGAALWCALHTGNFSDCVLTAVNLGDDSDTTGCVAGALAGAMYGYESIPAEWIDALRGRELIEQCLF